MPVPARTRLAARAGLAVAYGSRLAGHGGSVLGGRVTLVLDARALPRLSAGRTVALVSGTNGKTTTTGLLAAALGTAGPVVTNDSGANLPYGLVAALTANLAAGTAVLEVDEGALPAVVGATQPAVVVLLNLSRDQLDRYGEVRMIAARWRAALGDAPGTHVVANADDPIVVWAARAATSVTWVGAGQSWREDAATCPACGHQLRWEGTAWACGSCHLARPEPALSVDGDALVFRGGERIPVELRLPGRCNVANAAMAAAAAEHLSVPVDRAVAAMSETTEVAGRYRVVRIGSSLTRLLLAKNPAGWVEALDLLRPPPVPVVVAINARVADGRDPSWLWDVPFERLRGRTVVASGERAADLAVRLRYAEVEHETCADPLVAARELGAPAVDLAANYTAFQAVVGATARAG